MRKIGVGLFLIALGLLMLFTAQSQAGMVDYGSEFCMQWGEQAAVPNDHIAGNFLANCICFESDGDYSNSIVAKFGGKNSFASASTRHYMLC